MRTVKGTQSKILHTQQNVILELIVLGIVMVYLGPIVFSKHSIFLIRGLFIYLFICFLMANSHNSGLLAGDRTVNSQMGVSIACKQSLFAFHSKAT